MKKVQGICYLAMFTLVGSLSASNTDFLQQYLAARSVNIWCKIPSKNNLMKTSVDVRKSESFLSFLAKVNKAASLGNGYKIEKVIGTTGLYLNEGNFVNFSRTGAVGPLTVKFVRNKQSSKSERRTAWAEADKKPENKIQSKACVIL